MKRAEQIFCVAMIGNVLAIFLSLALSFPGTVIERNATYFLMVFLFLLSLLACLNMFFSAKNSSLSLRKYVIVFLVSVVLGLPGALAGKLLSSFFFGHLTKSFAKTEFSGKYRCVTSNFNRYSGSINILKDSSGNIIKFSGYEAFCPVSALGANEIYILSGREWLLGFVVEDIELTSQ